MEKIYQGNGFAIIENQDKIQITWSQGPYGESVFYDISRENMMKALKSEQDAYEVMIYAETGVWLSEKKGKQDEINKAFIRQFPELLLKIPDNQSLFDEDELKRLFEKANEYGKNN